MPPTALEILRNKFGFEGFREPQGKIIDCLLAGEDALVLMPTGGGKSLCYQIPAIIRPGTGVVISPLISLMQNQVEALRQLGFNAAYLNSSLSPDEQRDVETQFSEGKLDLLYVAPERLATERFVAILKRTRVSLFAIDEAHCVSQWGHDFRTDYLKLSLLHVKPFDHIPRIALTATADERTRQEIIARLGLGNARIFCNSFDRPNIQYGISPKRNSRAQLIHFLKSRHSGDAGIVYCLSRKRVEDTAQFLNEQGFRALPYHAGLDNTVRQKYLNRFLMEDSLIVVATVAFGMGIDKPDVRFVAHLDLPRSIEAYYQETGRAGRDGLPASAWMVYGLQDVITLRKMVEESESDDRHKIGERNKLEAMLGFCESTTCRRQILLRYFGEELKESCGNCDNCLSPPSTWDGTEAAQKALSCVFRTQQRFGAHHVIDVLTGKVNERIRRFGHTHLSTYGIGRDLSEKQWQSVFRQLIIRGFLIVDHDANGALKLSETCRPVLRSETKLRFRRDEDQASRTTISASNFSLGDPDNYRLWDALRALRKQLAEEQGVPPYRIFEDKVLMEMVMRRPKNLDQFSSLFGVGEYKLARYGADFLAVIAS